MARAGKVAITPKGTFENGTVYEKLDSVEYNGTLYIAKKASSGVLPTDTEYWMLAVDLTGKMDTTGDSQNNIVTFTSADATDPTGWQDVQVLTSKEKHLSIFNKISKMMSNMRYLYKILGTTDISALGTVTQAIANLNSNVGGIKGISSSAAITTQGQYALDAREKNASVDGTLANKIDVLNSNLSTLRKDVSKQACFTLLNGIYIGSGNTLEISSFYDRNIDEYDMYTVVGVVNPDGNSWATTSSIIPKEVLCNNIQIEMIFLHSSKIYGVSVVRVDNTHFRLINSNSGLAVKLYVFGIDKL